MHASSTQRHIPRTGLRLVCAAPVWTFDTPEALWVSGTTLHVTPLELLYSCMMQKTKGCHGQEYDWLEFFAGRGNLTRVMKSASYRAKRFDLLDNKQPPHRKSNYMNLLHASGFALLVFCSFPVCQRVCELTRWLLWLMKSHVFQCVPLSD